MLEAAISGKVINGGNVDYNAFVAAIASLTAIAPGTAPSTAEGYRKVTMATPAGTMWGTPYGNKVTYDSNMARIAQHCFPDTVTLNENITSKRQMAFKIHYLGSGTSYASLNRNGYSSSSYGTFNGCQILDFLYFDVATGRIMRVNPFTKTDPVPWDGKFL